jgi:hypothetical protein
MTAEQLAHLARTRRLQPGERVHLPDYGLCTVVNNTDQSLVELQTASGARLRLGRLALSLDSVPENGQ